MPADQIRNRTVGCKMTDSEAERLTAVAEQDGMTLGEWCREAILRVGSASDDPALAEIVGGHAVGGVGRPVGACGTPRRERRSRRRERSNKACRLQRVREHDGSK